MTIPIKDGNGVELDIGDTVVYQEVEYEIQDITCDGPVGRLVLAEGIAVHSYMAIKIIE